MNELIEAYEELLFIEIEKAIEEGAQPEKLNALREGIFELVKLRAVYKLKQHKEQPLASSTALTAREVINGQ